MDVDLTFLLEVEQDLDEAYAWYEERREGTGDDLLSRVNACIRAIRRPPEMRTLCYKHYRRALARKFPYAVYYRYFDSRERSRSTACYTPHSTRGSGEVDFLK